MTTSNPEYNWEQRVFCLSMLSIFTGEGKGTESQVEGDSALLLVNLLKDEAVKKLIGEWTIVWGPEVFQYDEGLHKSQLLPQVGESNVADNLVYMVKSENEPKSYVIAIAATNLGGLYDGLIEDLEVGKSRYWNRGRPWEVSAKDTSLGEQVSEGTSVGLRIINSMSSQIEKPFDVQDDREADGANVKTLVGYLSDLTSRKRIRDLTICGHSLGAALAPALALSLKDRRDDWDSSREKVKIYVSASAGASPGNQQLAWYYDRKLGKTTRRIWNSLDFVPKGWSKITIEEARTMFEKVPQTNKYINGAINYMKGLGGNVNYQQICASQNGFNALYAPQGAAYAANQTDMATKVSQKFIKAVIIPCIIFFDRKPRPEPAKIQVNIKEIFSNINKNGTLGDRPTTTPPVTLTPQDWKIAQDLSQLIDDLLPKLGEESYGDINLHNQTPENVEQLFGFLKYLWQLYYQHTIPYFSHLGVEKFIYDVVPVAIAKILKKQNRK